MSVTLHGGWTQVSRFPARHVNHTTSHLLFRDMPLSCSYKPVLNVVIMIVLMWCTIRSGCAFWFCMETLILYTTSWNSLFKEYTSSLTYKLVCSFNGPYAPKDKKNARPNDSITVTFVLKHFFCLRAMLPQRPRWVTNTDKLKPNFHLGYNLKNNLTVEDI